MKKILTLTLCLCLLLSTLAVLSACGHAHTYSEDYQADAIHHWHTCTEQDCLEKADVSAHTYDEGTVRVEPSLQAHGEIVYTCTVCGHEKSEIVISDTRVSAEEWNTILQFENTDNVRITATGSYTTADGGPIPSTVTYEKDGDTLYVKMTSADVVAKEFYVTYEDAQYRLYAYDKLQEQWTRKTITREEYDDCFPDLSRMFSYKRFEYDAVGKTFYNASDISYNGTTLSEVELGTVNGRLVLLTYKQVASELTSEYEYTFAYDAVTLTLPNVAA